MWWKDFFILHLVVLWNTISSQPVIQTKNARVPRQTNLEECCPCPGYRDGSNYFKDQDTLSTSRLNSLVRVPLDDCPCSVAGADSEGSPSIFHPSVLRLATPSHRIDALKHETKPLLRPEVGLASSVLETLREATDKEYQEALARDAARSAIKAVESDLFDAEPETTRNSVTIVFNPRDDPNSDYDTMPEASHIQETRCIHSPLGSANFMDRQRITSPRVAKEYLILRKRKPKILHKSFSDMDNSPSNIQESIDACSNDLSSKMKINPSLLSKFPFKSKEKTDVNSNTWRNSGTQLRKMALDNFNPLKTDGEFNNSPLSTLASLKHKLRDLTEMRNANRVFNNNKHSNNLNNLGYMGRDFTTGVAPLKVNSLSLSDSIYDDKVPVAVKNILKLKDVELIPPRKTITKDLTRDNMKYTDLKVAGTENSDDIVMMSNSNKKQIMNSDKCYAIANFNDSDENIHREPIEKQIIPKLNDMISNPSKIQSITDEVSNQNQKSKIKTSDNILVNETEPLCEESQISDEQAFVDGNINTNVDNESSDINRNLLKTIECQSTTLSGENLDEIKDSVPETTNNIIQQTSEEEVNIKNDDSNWNDSNEEVCQQRKLSMIEAEPRNLIQNTVENEGSYQHENSGLPSFKDDILRRLENLKNTIRSKLQDTENTKQPSDSNSNFNSNEQVGTNDIPKDGSGVTIHDLQKLSNSLLYKEDQVGDKLASPLESECMTIFDDTNSENARIFSNPLNDNESDLSAFDYTETQIDENALSSENISNSNYNATYSKPNTLNEEEGFHNLQNTKHTCDLFSSENDYVSDIDTDNILLKDATKINEMSSQASNFKYNAIRPQPNEGRLRSSLHENIVVQPSLSAAELSLFKKPLQIPSLEEIRQGITNILDEGQREIDKSGLTHDPLNESSNLNSVLSSNTKVKSKLPKFSNLENIDLDLYQLRPLQTARTNPSIATPRFNINSFKTKLPIPKATALKPLKLESVLGNQAGLFGASLSLDSDGLKMKAKPKSKLASGVLGIPLREVPTIDDIRSLLKTNTQNLFKIPTIQSARTNIERPLLSGQTITALTDDLRHHANNAVKAIQTNFKETNLDHQDILSSTRAHSNDLLETIARKREDMKEKFQALHEDFNDRLALVHDRLTDQNSLQSVNIPVYKENSKRLGLTNKMASETERDVHNSVPTRADDRERKAYSKTILPVQNKMSKNKNNKPLRVSQTLNTPSISKNNNNHIFKQNMGTLKETPWTEIKKSSHRAKNFEELKNNLGKQSGLTPYKNSKVKISFFSTTKRPIIESKLEKKPVLDHPTKFSLGSLKENNAKLNSKSKAVSQKVNKPKLKSVGDLNHSPSELMSSRISASGRTSENEDMENSEIGLDVNSPSKNIFNTNNVEPEPARINSGKQSRIIQKSALTNSQALKSPPSREPLLPKLKENSFLANIREAIRARLVNVTSTPKTLPIIEERVRLTSDTIQSPSEKVEAISVGNNLLKENTSYKCTMMCVKDP